MALPPQCLPCAREPGFPGTDMRITNKPDFPITAGGCKKATGKTLKQWFKELNKIDGLKQGRRASTQHIYASKADP